ncbi:MAG: TRAP transporter substrate-binding protein [Lachnospiraceae bacterium]|nr:TRAP transporter substrate-binding protein [Lachnospiraceae bacterium]
MKKLTSIALSIAMILCLMSGCGSKPIRQTADTPAATEAPQGDSDAANADSGNGTFVMRIGHAQTEESPRHRSLLYFKQQVEQKTDGKVKVEIYPNGELGDETEMTVSVSEGRLEAVRGGDLDFVPKSQLLSLPMIATDLEQARELCYSDFVADMLSSAETDYNMKVLAIGDDSGFRQITNNVRRIQKPEDIKGLKIRAPQIVATVTFFDEIGGTGTATVVPFTELYESLASGKVDGQENPLALIDTSKFYEVQKYCTLINYQFFPELMYVNLDWWNSLPTDIQTTLTKCAKDMMDECSRITDEENEQYMKHIQDNGCEIYVLTPDEREAFEIYAQRTWQKYVDQGYATKQDIEDMLSVIGKEVSW